jgi:hypothetical protein
VCGSRARPNGEVSRLTSGRRLMALAGSAVLVLFSAPWSSPASAAEPQFLDSIRHPFAGDIEWLYQSGITGGCAPSRFCPDASVTREQMASFLVRALDLPRAGRDAFTDDAASIHQSDINRLAAARITGGCAPARFCPLAVVTRAQMASFLARAFALQSRSLDHFGDDNRSIHNLDINRLAGSGITGGCAPGRFCPSAPVTRGQMAAFLHRAIESPLQPPSAGCNSVANVDASGGTDVTASLQAFLNASPNNSTACLVAGGQYRVDGMLSLDGRSGLTLNGQGARIFGTTTSNSPKLRFQLGNDLVVRNLTIESVHPEAGTSNAHVESREHGHAVAIYGALRLTLGPNLTLRNISGDGVYIAGGTTSSGFRVADGVTITGCRIERNGRMGVALTDGARNVVVSGCVLDQIAMYPFDLEPNGVVKGGVLLGSENVRFSDNTIGRYTIDPAWAPLLFTGTGNGPQRNIEFSRNTVTGGPLRIGVWNVAGSLRSDFRILDNRSSSRIAGPAMDFSGVAGLTVTGNTQPLSGGALATTSGCTNVTMTGNVMQ